MHKVYEAANLQEAHHLLNLLNEEGIDACVLNENSQGGMGELPLTLYPEVWIKNNEDATRSREIIEAYEKSEQPTAWFSCPHCGEDNPENFQVCWQCNEVLSKNT